MARQKKVQVRVTEELLARIDEICDKQHLTRSTLGEVAFERIVGELETMPPISPKDGR